MAIPDYQPLMLGILLVLLICMELIKEYLSQLQGSQVILKAF